MTTKRWLGVLGFTIFGILLFASWLLPGQTGFWYGLDSSVFFFFNHLIGQSQALLYLVAFTNLRPFDAVAFLFMLGIFYHYYRQQDAKGRRWMLCIGLTMLVTAVIAKQFDMMLGFERPSATKFFTLQGVPVLRVSELTGWPAKDWSSTSFPGDHGMMLLIVFSMPRIMSGAHWLTDVVVGSGSICSIVLSWMLLTPASDRIIALFDRYLPHQDKAKTKK